MDNLFKIVAVDHGERYDIKPHFADSRDVPRLTRQNKAILVMLRNGPVRNIDLITVALNCRARISEIRAYLEAHEGLTVECVPGQGGINSYHIGKRHEVH